MVVRPNRSIGDAIVPQIATKFTKIPLLHSGRKDILENLLPLLLLVRTNLFVSSHFGLPIRSLTNAISAT